MRGRRSAKAFPFLPAAAFVGVVVAHGLAYLAAFPQSLLRRQVLAETGHSYWAAAVALAVVFAAVSAITTIAEHIGRGIRHERPQSAGHRYRGALFRLGALQSVVFVLQEVLERVRAGVPLSGLAHGDFLLIGIAMQLLVAVAIAFVLTLLSVTGEAIGRAIASERTPRTTEAHSLSAEEIVRAAVSSLSDRPRAPPSRSSLAA